MPLIVFLFGKPKIKVPEHLKFINEQGPLSNELHLILKPAPHFFG